MGKVPGVAIASGSGSFARTITLSRCAEIWDVMYIQEILFLRFSETRKVSSLDEREALACL
jgi:hypothetical protein